MKIINFRLMLLFFAFLMLSSFQVDPDLGWHVTLGNKFLESARIVNKDEFSWTMSGYEWGNYFFGYQILIAFLENYLGHASTTLIFGLLGSLAVWILIRGRNLNFPVMLSIGLGILLLKSALHVRPSMISFLMFSILLSIVTNKSGQKKVWLWIPFWFIFFALWANFHQGFVVGLGIFWIIHGIEIIQSRKFKRKISIISMSAILSSFLGTFLTPFHLNLWRGILYDLTGSKTWSAIAEWRPIIYHVPLNLLFAASGAIFIYLLHKNFKKIEPSWAIVGCILFAWSFWVANSVFFWAAIYIFLIGKYADFRFSFEVDNLAKLAVYFPFLMVFMAFTLDFFANFLLALNFRNQLKLSNYPVEAVEFMKQNNLGYRLFNTYGWGGYLIWQFPETKVFIDGRMTGWRRDDHYILADYIAINKGKCELVTAYAIRTVLVRNDEKPLCFGDFETVYEDSVAKVLIKPI